MVQTTLIPLIKESLMQNIVPHDQDHDIVVDATREGKRKNGIKNNLMEHARLHHEK